MFDGALGGDHQLRQDNAGFAAGGAAGGGEINDVALLAHNVAWLVDLVIRYDAITDNPYSIGVIGRPT